MPTALESLQAAYNQVCANIAKLTADIHPDYSVDGQGFQWNSTLTTLIEQRDKLKRAIQQEGGPWIVDSRGRT